MSVARWIQNWKQTLQIVQPDTLLRWHREGFRLFWRFKPSTCGSGQVSRGQKKSHRLGADTIALIQRLAGENRLWGAERIHTHAWAT